VTASGVESTADRRRLLAEALRARRGAPAPLAPNQERLFVLQQMEPVSTAYAESVVLRLSGALDAEALETALRGLPVRHEWLRSRVEVRPDGPVQVVDDATATVVERADLSAAGRPGSRDELAPAAEAWVRGLVETSLSLEAGPPWRAGIARLADDDHLLVLVVHHIACDATSLAVLLEELGDRYDAAVEDRPLELATPRSPRDLARAVRAWQSSDAARAAVAAAATALVGADLGARLGADQAPAAGSPGAAGVCVRSLPPNTSGRIDRVAAEHGVTPFSLVCAAVGAVLADTMDVATPVLGVPVDLRWNLEGSDDTVSFLVETVAVALPEAIGRPLVPSALAVRDAVTAALEQPPPFDEVVAAVRAAGELPATGTPLHAYVNWLDGEERETLGARGPAVRHVDLAVGRAKFDLSWTAVARGRDLDLRLEYDSARLDGTAADRLVQSVVRLLDVATQDPARPLRDLELLSATELARLREWEGRPSDEPTTDLYSSVRQGLLAADGPVLLAGDETVTGQELLARVDLLAAALRGAGVGPGDRVAVPSRRTPGMLVALLATLRAGGTFLPVDVSHPSGRQADLTRAARVRAVVGAPSWAGDLAAATGAQAVPTDASGRPQVPVPPVTEWPQRSTADLAYVMYTSGSTGRPKAVRVPDSAVVARVASYREVLADGGVRFLLQSTLAFDASIYLFWALATGGCLVLPADEQAADPLALAGLMEQHGVTDAFFVPALYEAVLRMARPGGLRAFRRVCVGGDVVPPAVAALHHDTVPEAVFLDVYGPTEVVVTSTASPITGADLADGRPLPIGRPHPGTVARVLDRHGRRVAVGAVGELHLGGPCVADGYERPWGAPPNGEPFTVRKDDDGRLSRWYATGDLVRWRPDGRLDYVGRRDRQVKLRGQRVELGEIEAAARRVPGVAEAAVELLGTGAGRRVALFVAPEVQDVRACLADVLPEAWLPDLVVARPELPRLPSGKLDRSQLRDNPAMPRAETGARPAPHDATGQTGLERTVLATVRMLLDDEGIVLDDDFFDVGGNSLLAARLVGQLSAMLGVAVPLHELAGSSTLRGIAALADRDLTRGTAATREDARLVPVRERGSLPPAVLVARDGATSLVLQHFLSRVESERPLWVLLRPMPPLGYRLPDLAADGAAMARLLLDRFPEGPVHVIGHSASGIVAVEIARSLGGRRGRTVLLDTVPPSRWSRTPVRAAAGLARVALQRWELRREGIRPPRPGDPEPDPRTARALRLYQDGVAAARAAVRPVDFPLTVLTTAATREELGRDDIGWRRWASQLDLVPVGGDHMSLLLQPDVVETAQLVEEVLATWS
jgi:amino acid adenylation domain-containing protein